jgi:oligopeptide/dipeptide ABC transporter ATP-binding protein
MEYADAKTLFSNPKHPYTVGLMESIPVLGRKEKKKAAHHFRGGAVPVQPAPGCFSATAARMFLTIAEKVEPHVCEVGEQPYCAVLEICLIRNSNQQRLLGAENLVKHFPILGGCFYKESHRSRPWTMSA